MTSWVLNHQQAHWSMFLSQFDFKLDYAPGKKNPANTPSRCPDYVPQEGDEVVKFQNKSPLTNYHLDWLFPCLHSLTSLSPQISSLTMFMIDNSELLEEFKNAFWNNTEWHDTMSKSDNTFSFSGNLVFHDNHLFVPSSLRSEILYSRHDLVLTGHPGQSITFDLVKHNYSWPRMRTFIWQYISSCEQCSRVKNVTHRPYSLLQPLKIPNWPWQSISMDFIIKLPPSHSYNSIWVVCNQLTRATHFIPIQESMDAPELAWLFLDSIFHHHGFPQVIVSDQGSLFISLFFTQLMKICSTKMKPSTVFHPQTDGLTEQTNQTLWDIPTNLLFISTRWLGQLFSPCGICIQ